MGAAPTRHPEYEHPLPGWGAFKHADVDDAKRRRPAGTLEPLAGSRGMTFLDSADAPGFRGVMPGDGRLQFNVCHGELAPGRTGVVFHEVFPVEEETGADRGPRGVVTYVFNPEKGKRFALSFVPILGDLMADKDKRPPAVGVPATVAAALVPEAAVVPEFEVSSRTGVRGNGLPELPADFADRLMSTAFADALRAWSGRPYFHAVCDHARLAFRVDGYLGPDEAAALGAAVAGAADGLAATAAADHRPAAFTEPLAAASWPGWDGGPKDPGETFDEQWVAWHRPPPPWFPGLREQMAAHDGAAEDVLAFHRAFPHLPVPGKAFAVIRRGFPGTSARGRVAWFAEQQILVFDAGSNAVLLPAAQGAPEAEPADGGGGVTFAVRDGVFCAWAPREPGGPGGIDALAEHALRLGRDTGLAAL